MNTFKRYLLYYIGLLLLPVFIMSTLFSHVVSNFCTAQLIEQNMSALKQLCVSIEIQREQMDAYAVQTTTRSDFFARNQITAGDVYSVQHILKQWLLADSFVDDVFYYNTELGKIYSYNAVYNLHNFIKWRLGSNVVTDDELQAIFDSGVANTWLLRDNKLYYLSSARISQKEHTWLIFEISPKVLDTYATSSKLYDSVDISIADEDGQLLYHSGRCALQPFYEAAADQGEMGCNSNQMMYARISNDKLTFLSIVPKNVILSPLRHLWFLFSIGILVIDLLGAVVIFFAMRMNYRPIKELENVVLDAQVLEQPTNDAITNVSQAFNKIQQRNNAIVSKSAAIAKERVIFRLLLGSYQTFDAFNQEGELVHLHLDAEPMYIINIRNHSNIDEELAPMIVDRAKTIWNDQRTVMFVEIPENQDVILVVSGKPNTQEAEQIGATLSTMGLDAVVKISELCDTPAQLASAWLSLFDDHALVDSSTEGSLSQEFLGMLTNALDFGEPDRVQFVIEGMVSMLNSLTDQDLRLPLLDVLYAVRIKCSSREETIAALDSIPATIRDMAANNADQAAVILRRIGQVLYEYLTPPVEDENTLSPLCQQIVAYLEENYTNVELNVQCVADNFNISLSNMSHYFKSHMGVPVSSYVENLRISHSQELLQTTNQSVNDIAIAVGYAQPATFMRAFKKQTGVSPTTWRKQINN